MTQNQLIQAAALFGCIAALSVAPSALAAQQLHGAGARFPFPLFAGWFMQFSRDPAVRDAYNSTGVRVSFRATDSQSGLEDLLLEAVDFAAADWAISDDEIKGVERGVVPLPITAGEVVLAYNLGGVDGLRLPRAVYPKIFSGEIANWSHAAIAEANSDVTLPDQPITVIVRVDAARTSAVLSAHLSAIDPGFREAIGESRSPQWPADQS